VAGLLIIFYKGNTEHLISLYAIGVFISFTIAQNLIAEFQTKKWWHRLLHNQTGVALRTLLILHEDVIVTTVPFHLKK